MAKLKLFKTDFPDDTNDITDAMLHTFEPRRAVVSDELHRMATCMQRITKWQTGLAQHIQETIDTNMQSYDIALQATT